jgi:RNA polymerase sigma-70 factor (ECF subfamily)
MPEGGEVIAGGESRARPEKMVEWAMGITCPESGSCVVLYIGDRRGVRMEQSSQPVTDREFLDEFLRSGDEGAFTRLMERYKSRLFNVAFRVLYDRQAAEDVVQRVFVGLAERKADLAKVRSLQSWLYATTVNLSLDMLKTMRRRKVREKVAESSTGPESPRDVAMRSELRKELDLALAGLKNSLRIPLILRYLEGLSHEEAGEILGVSSEAVRKRVRRGLRALRALLKARNLVLPLAVIEGALKATPAEAVSASFLASASSVLRTASTADSGRRSGARHGERCHRSSPGLRVACGSKLSARAENEWTGAKLAHLALEVARELCIIGGQHTTANPACEHS